MYIRIITVQNVKIVKTNITGQYGHMVIWPYMAKYGQIWPYGHMAIGPYPKKIWASGVSPERPIKM